jgi:hypothetical protein
LRLLAEELAEEIQVAAVGVGACDDRVVVVAVVLVPLAEIGSGGLSGSSTESMM